MKRKQYIPVALIFVLAILVLIFYNPPTKYKTLNGETQGTYYNIKFEDRPSRNLHRKIDQQLEKFDLSLSSYKPNSIISKINNNQQEVKTDKYFRTVFNKAEEVYHLTDGAFDITVAPLVNAWGFGPKSSIKVDSSKIDSILNFVGMDKISLKKNYVVKSNPNVQLDVNAIAQGYSVDVICDFLERKSISNYLVEIGGEVRAKGINPKGEIWRIGIDKPFDNNFSPGKYVQAIIALNNKALATSGNYRKFHEIDGVKYSHSINPKTGYPINSRLLSTTVMAEDGITADAFATAFMIMGLQKSILFLSKHKEIDAYLIYNDDEGNYKSYITPGMKNSIKIEYSESKSDSTSVADTSKNQ